MLPEVVTVTVPLVAPPGTLAVISDAETTGAIPAAERRFAIEVPVRALHQGCLRAIAIRAACLVGTEAVKAGEGLCLGAHRQAEEDGRTCQCKAKSG